MHRPRSLIGPLFFYDLVRLARRGRSTLLRCVYALALLAALCFSYYLHFPGSLSWQGALTSRTHLPLHDLADFNRGFLLIVLLTQSAAVLLITPIYFAGAIAEERENKTLLLLFSASLGVWLSLVCRNTLRAQLSMALMLLLLFVGAWLQLINQPIAYEFSSNAGDWWDHVWQVGLNPFAAWWLASFSCDEWREAMTHNDEVFRVRLRALSYGLALLVLLAGLFGVAARRRLRTEPRH